MVQKIWISDADDKWWETTREFGEWYKQVEKMRGGRGRREKTGSRDATH